MAVLRLKDADGKIVAVPAIKGDTPVKGVDYFTEAEKVELRNEVYASLPALEMVATLDDGSTKTYRIYGGVVTE